MNDQIARAKEAMSEWPQWMRDASRTASASLPAGPRALADLPRFADAPQAAADGFRANLLQKDAEQLARTNRLLRESLAELLPLAGRAARTPADDAVIERATRVLKLGSLL
ncbi:MAG: hypothetical protein LC121_01750 [Anaerolineae bacterium]|nr:hypothetical protein [Anaerolineae bacterium]